MSTIGPGTIGALNIAGSFAGTQRTDADSDRIKAEATERKSQADREALAAQVLDDVGETDLTPERDADGRMPYAFSRSGSGLDEEEFGSEQSAGRPPDAFGERGNVLDLEA